MSKVRVLMGTGVGAAIAALVLPATAQDGGVSLVFGIDQRIEADDNLDLDPDSAGTTVTATTGLSFGLSSETALDSFSLDLSTALRASDGPGGTDTFLDDQRIGLDYTREGARARFGFDANYRRARIDYLRPLDDFVNEAGELELPDDLADLEEAGTRISYALGTELELGVDAPAGLTFDARVSGLDYEDVTDPDLVTVRRGRFGATGRLDLSPVLSSTLAVRRALYEADDAEDTRRETDTVEAGLDYEISPAIRAELGVGYSVLDVEEFGIVERSEGTLLRFGLEIDRPNGQITARLDSRLTDEGTRQDLSFGRSLDLPRGAVSAEIGVSGLDWEDFETTAALSWRHELPRGDLSARLRRSVVVNNDDEDELVTALSVNYRHELTALAGLDLSLAYSVSDEGAERTDRANVSATYRYALTEDWTLSAGYRHRLRDEEGEGRATSNAVFLGLGRTFEAQR